jgi:CHAT domain-containing protein
MSTAAFMEAFYRRLQAGANKADALRQAMRDLRERYPHPFYWAPFVLVGHARR